MLWIELSKKKKKKENIQATMFLLFKPHDTYKNNKRFQHKFEFFLFNQPCYPFPLIVSPVVRKYTVFFYDPYLILSNSYMGFKRSRRGTSGLLLQYKKQIHRFPLKTSYQRLTVPSDGAWRSIWIIHKLDRQNDHRTVFYYIDDRWTLIPIESCFRPFSATPPGAN